MGLLAGVIVHARHRDEPDRRYDRRTPYARRACHSGWLAGCLIWLCAFCASAETYRIATFNIGLIRDGPGILLRDLIEQKDVAQVADIADVKPDILALQGFDYDVDWLALNALQDLLIELGHPMEYAFTLAPNSGVATPFDLNRNGKFDEAEDAEGFGKFNGQGGMAVLSRYPIDAARAVNFSRLKWAEQAWAEPPKIGDRAYFSDEEWRALPLFSVAAWAVPIDLPEGALWVLTGQSSTPVFDGPEDRNGLRNAAQSAFWAHLSSGGMAGGWSLPSQKFVFAGGVNADPKDGQGRKPELLSFLESSAVQDVLPQGQGGENDPDPHHAGSPAQDTVKWRRGKGPGNLRVDYVLPSVSLRTQSSGVHWPAAGIDDDLFRHFLVWVDILWE